MNEQFLSDFKSPTINGMAARRVLANEMLYNLAQGIIEANGKGVTQKFTKDTEGAQIRVLRILPLKQKSRELGSALNGGNFNSDKESTQSETVGIDVITVIDSPIDIAQVTQDMIPVDLLDSDMKNFSNLVNRNINAMTIGGKLGTSLSAEDANITYFDASIVGDAEKKEINRTFLNANDKLNDGDEEHGVDLFPVEDRVCVARSNYITTLKTFGILSIGGSNAAQALIASDGITNGKVTDWIGNGYVGDFDGVPVHIAAKAIYNLAEEYAGVPKGEFKKIMGYFSSAMANSRGVATGKEVKVIDHPDGQGIRLQPLVRMGFESWYPKGNSIMVDAKEGEYVNPFTSLKALYSEYKFKNKAPGSRVYPIVQVTETGTSATATISYPTDKYGNTLGFTKRAVYFWSADSKITTISAFYAGYQAAKTGNRGEVTSGTAVSVPTTSGTYYLHVLAISDDGSVTVKESKAVTKA